MKEGSSITQAENELLIIDHVRFDVHAQQLQKKTQYQLGDTSEVKTYETSPIT